MPETARANRSLLARIGIAVLWVLGQLPPRLRRQVCERLALGRSLALNCTAWFGSAADVRRAVRVEGLGHLAATAGAPRILFAPHFVGLEAAAIRLSLEHPAVAMYSTQKARAFDRFLAARRARFGEVRLVARERGVRPALCGLRRGLPLLLQPDMDFGPRDSMFVSFFGTPAATVPVLSRIARLTGAGVLTVVAELEPRDDHGGVAERSGADRVVRIAPFTDFPGHSVESDTPRMNELIEEHVRRMPEQYYWIHKRFKTRPPGTPPVYA